MIGGGSTRLQKLADLERDEIRRAVSPVIGVALMIVLVALLASVTTGLLLSFGDDIQEPAFQADHEDHPWDDDSLLAPEDPTAGATDVRYRVYFEMEGEGMNDPFHSVDIVVDAGDSMFVDVEWEDIERFYIESDDGRTDLTDSSAHGVSKSSNNREDTLTIDISDNTVVPEEGDAVVLLFDAADNPTDPNTYDVDVTVTNGKTVQQNGELEIIEE